MFGEAVDYGVEYIFSFPVSSVIQRLDGIQVRGISGQTFRAHKVVCTIPLNVLKDVQFIPPLSTTRREAIELGHVNQMSKINVDVSNPELEGWNGMRFPGTLMYSYGDGVLPNGNVHLVGFGKDEKGAFVPEENPKAAVDAFEQLHPMNVQRMASHYDYLDTIPHMLMMLRYSTIGVPIHTLKGVRHGGGLDICPSIRMGFREDMEISSLLVVIGLMAGALEQGIMNAQTIATELRPKGRLGQSRL